MRPLSPDYRIGRPTNDLRSVVGNYRLLYGRKSLQRIIR